MRDIIDIIEIIKDIISFDCGERKVFDKDVEKVLGVKAGAAATWKSRNVIPYSHLVLFAAKRKVDLNYLLIESKDYL